MTCATCRVHDSINLPLLTSQIKEPALAIIIVWLAQSYDKTKATMIAVLTIIILHFHVILLFLNLLIQTVFQALLDFITEDLQLSVELRVASYNHFKLNQYGRFRCHRNCTGFLWDDVNRINSYVLHFLV